MICDRFFIVFTPLNRGRFFPLRFLRFSSQTHWSGFSDFFLERGSFFPRSWAIFLKSHSKIGILLTTKNSQKKQDLESASI
ncbi:hypothetical protein DLM78_14520 [Leptospira stimsonii]|uniref:Uncharacterized protein n=1 Tax=Leptospira stimsonii TaxID=2202203 RepID=A0A8B3CPP9_9LEPT|nr:hypothetical protein DLM78_14520 [Leptospira stimsonii]